MSERGDYLRLRTFLKPLSFIPALLIMYAIFSFSAQEAEVSSSLSYKASYMIIEAADYILDAGLEDYQIADYAGRFNGVTRKIAHMAEYFALAVAVSFPLYVYGLHGLLLVLIAGAFCIAFACGDEYHQSYVVGRAASVKDVGIDSFGVLMGILLVRIIGWTGRHTLFRPSGESSYDKQARKELKNLKKQQQQMRKEMEARYTGPYRNGSKDPRYAARNAYDPRDPRYAGRNAYDPRDPRHAGQNAYDPRDPRYMAQTPYNPQDPRYAGGVFHPGDPRYTGYPPGSQPQYYGNSPYGLYDYEDPDDLPESSDDLSEDMPLSGLLNPKK